MRVELDVAQVMATLASMVLVIGGLAATVAAIRKWIQNLATTARNTKEQLATSNGRTVGEYVEQTSKAVDAMGRKLGEVASRVGENRDLARLAADRADEAARLAQLTADRLDAHMKDHQ